MAHKGLLNLLNSMAVLCDVLFMSIPTVCR